MTTEEWLEIVSWVNDRFTPGWTPDRAVAYGTDLRQFHAEDVWDAINRMYARGLEYAPNGSQLMSETTQAVRDRIERAKLEARGLPPGSSEPLGWEVWRENLGYVGLSVDEAIRQRHGELFPAGCPHSGCDVCGNVLDVTTTRV